MSPIIKRILIGITALLILMLFVSWAVGSEGTVFEVEGWCHRGAVSKFSIVLPDGAKPGAVIQFAVDHRATCGTSV